MQSARHSPRPQRNACPTRRRSLRTRGYRSTDSAAPRLDRAQRAGTHLPPRRFSCTYTFACRSRNALATTETELNDIAAAAITGDSRTPKKGYRMPAATGTPRLL